jgi:hypothetical protein
MGVGQTWEGPKKFYQQTDTLNQVSNGQPGKGGFGGGQKELICEKQRQVRDQY